MTDTVTISRDDANRLRGVTVAIEAKHQELLAALANSDLDRDTWLELTKKLENDRLVIFWKLTYLTQQVLQ